MPNITIQNNYNGSVSYNYNIFTIPELGVTFPYYSGTVPEGTQVTLNLADVSGCYVHTTTVDSTDYGHTFSIPLTMGSSDMVVTTYSHSYSYKRNRVKIGQTTVLDLSDASMDLTASRIETGKSVYDGNGQKITGTLDLSNDTVTQSDVVEGRTFHNNGYTQQTGTLTVNTTEAQMVDSAEYITLEGPFCVPSGSVKNVRKSPNCIADNIKSGVMIQGITGTYSGSSPEMPMSGSLVGYTASSYYLHPDTPITEVRDYAFYNPDKKTSYLTTLDCDFSGVTKISTGAFSNCKARLTSSDFGDLTTIEVNAFNGSSLQGAFEKSTITKTDSYAFQYTAITSVNLPNCTTGGSGLFQYCTSLTEAYLNAMTTIYSNSFNGCTALQTVECTSATALQTGSFMGCTSLTSGRFNVVTSVQTNAFNGCTNPNLVLYLPYAGATTSSYIAGSAFKYVVLGANISLPTTYYITTVSTKSTVYAANTTAKGTHLMEASGTTSISLYKDGGTTAVATLTTSSTTYTDADIGTFTRMASGKLKIEQDY